MTPESKIALQVVCPHHPCAHECGHWSPILILGVQDMLKQLYCVQF